MNQQPLANRVPQHIPALEMGQKTCVKGLTAGDTPCRNQGLSTLFSEFCG